MRSRILLSFTSTILVVASLPFSAHSQDVCKRAENLVQQFNKSHLITQEVNDSLSERVFSAFLDLLDNERNFLTQQDSIQLNKFNHILDDEIISGTCSFLPTVTALFSQRVSQMLTFSDSILQRPFDYSKPESITAFQPGLKKKFSKDNEELKKKLIRELKFKVLMKAWRMAQMKNERLSLSSFASLEKQSREKVSTSLHHILKNLHQPTIGLEAFVENTFMKSICHSFDPHSEFFTSDEMQLFEKSLSTSALSYGVEFKETQTGEFQVSRISSGGPAWKSLEIKQGDVLLSITLEKELPIEVADIEFEEIITMINNMTSMQATFSLRKPDGKILNVLLKKEKIENSDNLISSFILEGAKKIGYISLPGFYTSDEDLKGKGCAGDVARELIKLKRDGIEGLILDLRFNGGGSVQEAIELAGIFIDAGPLAVFEEKGGKLVVLKDVNRGSAYNGPLVIMINTFSASASELVAAGLQDYSRAIIFGSSSFGKATGQGVFPVDGDEKSFVKITTDRVYRVDGTSIQLDGVTPDIRVPEIAEVISERERFLLFPLPAKKMGRKISFTAQPALSLENVRANSLKRTNSSAYFNGIKKFAQALQYPVPVEIKEFITYMDVLSARTSELKVSKDTVQYKVYSSKLNKTLLDVDTYHREMNDTLTDEIEKSSYIGEAYNILVDYIQSSNSKP